MKTSRGICILKAWGKEEELQVPKELEGFPVTEIGPYAFSEAELPGRFKIKEEERRRAVTGADTEGRIKDKTKVWENVLDKSRDGDTVVPLTGNRLRAIRLPSSLRIIGDYAFYGCRKLKEISFAGSVERIGSGAFMGCGSVDRLEFTEKSMENNTLYLMLSELRYAMEIVIRRQEDETAFVIPEYYESSVENIPARILELHYQGTGYRYRQCFRGGAIDYREYDRLFGLAESQEPPEILVKLAYDRIRYPDGLSEEAKKMYLKWLGTNVREAGEYFLKRDDLFAVRAICEAGGFDGMAKRRNERRDAGESRKVAADGAGDFYMASMGEHVFEEEEQEQGDDRKEGDSEYEEESRASLDILIEMAGHMGRAEIVSYLMDYRYRRIGAGRKKTFEL